LGITGDQVLLWVKSGAFKVPIVKIDKNIRNVVPMILIGPGTGVAPMRAILQERVYNRSDYKSSKSVLPESQGQTLLFFGCRNRSNDFLYKEEWEVLNSIPTVNDESIRDSSVDNEVIEVNEEGQDLLDPDVYGVGGVETVMVAFSRDQTQKVFI
jgi:sulfite reductase alpha subunit-like flavoprotein